MKAYRLLAICFITLFCSSNIWSQNLERSYNRVENASYEKIYVSPDQIEVTEEGVLYYDESEEILMLFKALSYDSKGLYLTPPTSERGPCGIHNLWCHACGGCGVIYCPMKCICPNGVGGHQP